MENQYELLGIPRSARLKNRIAFNQIYSASNLSVKEQKEFSKYISKIYLIAEINNHNCNYNSYITDDYRIETIQFIYIELINDTNIEIIDNLLHRLFPNPVILIYDYNNKYAYSSSLKRINKVDNSKIVVEEINNTSLNVQNNFYEIVKEIFNNKNIKNLFEVYKLIDDSIYYQMIFQVTNKFEYNLTLEQIKEKYKQIDELNKENRQLQMIYNSEKNKAKQMDLYMKIKINNNCIEKLIKEIEK